MCFSGFFFCLLLKFYVSRLSGRFYSGFCYLFEVALGFVGVFVGCENVLPRLGSAKIF